MPCRIANATSASGEFLMSSIRFFMITSRSIGSRVPTGSVRITSPNRLPSVPTSCGCRRLTGTMAFISTSSVGCPSPSR